jgi:hypothetical protein
MLFRTVKNFFRIWGNFLAQPDLARALEATQSDVDKLTARLSASDQDLFHRVAGHALTAWAKMEENLVMLVAVLLLVRSSKAGLILYSIMNFNTWLTIIDELFILEPRYIQFKPRWDKICASLRRNKDYRDRLAHHPIDRESNDDIKGKATSRPSRFDVRRKPQSFRPLTVDQVIQFSERIITITDELQDLLDEMIEYVGSESLEG